MHHTTWLFLNVLGMFASPSHAQDLLASPETWEAERIQPYVQNPAFWQYRGVPTLLLGGSSDDNIFQHQAEHLIPELDRLRANGGNYIRCTLSSRDAGNVQPYQFNPESARYDLEAWNEEYWSRLKYFLKAAEQRGMIVQMEIWATYDFYTRGERDEKGRTTWQRNPFNPLNNVNYDEWESGLFSDFQSAGHQLINPFFNTPLPLAYPFDFENTPLLLAHQRRFVDKVLTTTLPYNNLLYVIDNETNADPRWALYWAQYMRRKAAAKGVQIEVTEMWDTMDPSDGRLQGAGVVVQDPANHFFTLRSGVSNTLYDTENYSYLDISNHNAQKGAAHYQTGLYVWQEIQRSHHVRPLNNTKVYGGTEGGWSGSQKDGEERFWRNLFSGAAAIRFHRPPAGLGDSDLAMTHLKSMRLLTASVDIFKARPRPDLIECAPKVEVYCMSCGDGEYLLFFPTSAEVRLDLEAGVYEVRWLRLRESSWEDLASIKLPGRLETPGDGMWAARIARQSP